jgi:hypothetical protein
LCTLLALAIGGCSRGENASHARYVPSVRAARCALEMALTSWQRGESDAKIESVSPAVQVVDTKRPSDKKLASVKVTNEEDAE